MNTPDRFLRHLLATASLVACAGPVPAFTITPTETSITSADIVNPMRGWYNHEDPVTPAKKWRVDADTLDDYERFGWRHFENTTAGVYDWSVLDTFLDAADQRVPKQKVGLRIRCITKPQNNDGITGTLTPQYLIDHSLPLGKGFMVDLDKDADIDVYHDISATALNTFINTELGGDKIVSFRVEAADAVLVKFHAREMGSSYKPKLTFLRNGTLQTATIAADGFVQSNNSADLTGTQMEIKNATGNYQRVIYLKFNLPNVAPGTITNAKLSLYCSDMDAITGVKVYSVTNDAAVNESTLSWSNKPAGATLLTTYAIGTHGSAETYIPDWNDSYFQTRAQALFNAMSARYKNDPRISFIDIGFMGIYGEWHMSPVYYPTEVPAGNPTVQATAATKRLVVDWHVNAFHPNIRLVMMTDDDAALYYALTHPSDPLQLIGIRRDSLGSSIWNNLNDSSKYPLSYALAKARWQTAPMIAEPISNLKFGSMTTLAQNQVKADHVTMINNINWHIDSSGNGFPQGSPTDRETARMIGKLSGYRFVLKDFTMPDVITPGTAFDVVANWKNEGYANLYEEFVVKLQLRDAAGNVAAQWTSTADLPGFNGKTDPTPAVTHTVNDHFTPSGSLPLGSYSAMILIEDVTGTRDPLTLAITASKNAYNGYTLGTVEAAAVVDDFNDGDASDWTPLGGLAGSAPNTPQALNTAPLCEGPYYGYFDFQGSANTWRYVMRMEPSSGAFGASWATQGANAIRFRVKSSVLPPAGKLKFQLREGTTGERWGHDLTGQLSTTDFVTITIPLNGGSFTHDTDSPAGNNQFDLANIDQIRFFADKYTQAFTLKVDRIEVIKQ